MAETRRPLVSGNWKMNLNHFEAIQTLQKLNWALTPEDHRAAAVSIHPPFTDLRSVQTLIEADKMNFALGAQNCHFEVSGAFTGEVSPAMLEKLNVDLVIVGHSERRAYFGETNEIVNRKVQAVFAHNMTPIICVGELDEQREAGEANDVVATQLCEGLAGVSRENAEKLVVAYEPVWAIGTGKAATLEDAQNMCKHIRGVLKEIFDADAAKVIRIQYGGSVKPSNAKELLGADDIDGFLVGGASLVPDDFAKIVAAAHD